MMFVNCTVLLSFILGVQQMALVEKALCEITPGTKAKVQSGDSEKAREVLEKAVAAVGGADKLKNIENIRIRTEGVLFHPQSGTEIKLNVTETIEYPDKTRQVFDIPQGQRIQVLNGEDGWFKIGDEVGEPPESQIREMKRGLFRDTLNLLKHLDGGDLRLEYIAEEVSGDTKNHVVRIKDLVGDFINLYIDAQDYLVRKKTYRGASEVGLAMLEETYSQFKEVEGVKIPFTIVVRANGKKFIENRIIDAEFNRKLDADFFLPQ